MQVTIVLCTGVAKNRTFPLNVDMDWSGLQLKEAVCKEVHGHTVEEVRLVSMGRVIQDQTPLSNVLKATDQRVYATTLKPAQDERASGTTPGGLASRDPRRESAFSPILKVSKCKPG